MKLKKMLTLSTLLLCAIFSSQKSLAVDPKIHWKMIETEHFKIVYDSRQQLLGEKYALFAEQAYSALFPVFKDAPIKTTLVLNDNTDLSNGYSTDLPYPLIMLYPVLPGSLDTISDYGNWGLELVTHEYTHTLNMEPTHGLIRPLRWIFGSIVRPNMVLPRWYLEGLAVEMETQFSSFGRLRSANYLAIARAMVEQGTLRKEDISRINETAIPDWPGGARPYLLGALMWNQLIQQKGDEVIYDLNQRYSRRVPFLINGALEDVAGIDYPTLLDQTDTQTEKNSQKQISAIKAAHETKYEKFVQKGQFSHSPYISPDGKKLLYIGTNYRNDDVIRLVERSGSESFVNLKAKKLVSGDSIEKVSWFPDSQSFVFDKMDDFDHYYEFYDLYRYDLNDKKSKQITKGLRAREPVVSPSNERIYFVQNTQTNTRLCSVDSDGKDFRIEFDPPFQSRIARPEFFNSNEIIFSQKNDDGIETLVVLNLKTKSTKKVLAEFAPAHFPRMTAEGLLFVSDKSGVANAMLANHSLTKAWPITNTTTRAMTPEYDAQASEYIYSRLYSEGPQLVRMSLEESKKAPARLPQVGSLVDTEWKHHTPPNLEVQTKEKDFSVWPYLVPRYWMPWFFLSSTENYYSASTSAGDPLGKHAYSLTAYYDTYPAKPGFFGDYINNTTDLLIELDAADEYDRFSTTTLRHNTAAVITFADYIPGMSNDWSAGLGWRYDQTFIPGLITAVRNGPQVFFSYKNASQKGVEISPESGGALKASYTKFLKGLGNFEYDRIDAVAQYFHSKWLPDRHVLTPVIRATVEPGLHRLSLAPTSYSNGQVASTLSSYHVMRGYDPNTFVGRNMISGSLEYRFPIAYTYKGFGTTPLFLQRLHGALLADAITLDGIYNDLPNKSVGFTRIGGRMFMSAGGELRADTTIGYQLPVMFTLGLYYAFDDRAGTRSVVPFLGFQM